MSPVTRFKAKINISTVLYFYMLDQNSKYQEIDIHKEIKFQIDGF